MDALTLRQQEILGYLRLHARQQGYWPSVRDIQAHFGFKSTNAVAGHLAALEAKGAIARVPGQARAYRLVGDVTGAPVLGAAESDGDLVDLPVYGAIPAGYPDGLESSGVIDTIQVDRPTVGRRSQRRFGLRVQGDSMVEAGIFDGDVVVVEPREARDGDIVAALIDGATTLKRFISRPGCPPYLKAENPKYPDLRPAADLQIQGVAVSVVRRLD